MESMGVIVGLLFYRIVISHYRKNGKNVFDSFYLETN